ncbi:hypothetical protein ACIO8G_34650 [Streptomyces sp. NPDC087219]|uniref:hypothetical protein n=1 Tax=Streptomyces sp. NPDC087219 TaxID=3365770 RepID=UPI00381C5DE7
MDQLKAFTTDQWAVIVAAGAALVASVIALWQAAIARKAARSQLALQQRIHREQNEPYVIVDIQPDPYGAMLLVVENTGPTVARDVRISCEPPLESGWAPEPGQPDLTQVLREVLGQPIPLVPPRRRLTFLFDDENRFQNPTLPRRYTFTVDANGPAGQVETVQYTVDLDAVKWALITERPTKKVEDKLSKIGEAITRTEKAIKDLAPGSEPQVPRRRTRPLPVAQQSQDATGDT